MEDAALRVADNAERRSLFTYTTLHTHTHTPTHARALRCMHGRDGVRAHVHVTAAAIIGAANINEMIMANDARASKNLAAVLTREEEIYRSRREILMGN